MEEGSLLAIAAAAVAIKDATPGRHAYAAANPAEFAPGLPGLERSCALLASAIIQGARSRAVAAAGALDTSRHRKGNNPTASIRPRLAS